MRYSDVVMQLLESNRHYYLLCFVNRSLSSLDRAASFLVANMRRFPRIAQSQNIKRTLHTRT